MWMNQAFALTPSRALQVNGLCVAAVRYANSGRDVPRGMVCDG